MNVEIASNAAAWDAWLLQQRFRPFLQTWTMGEVLRDCGEEPLRLAVCDAGITLAQCQATVVDAKRGRHLSLPYGPVFSQHIEHRVAAFQALLHALKDCAAQHRCSFIRMSPFIEECDWPHIPNSRFLPSPHHLLAEKIWYLPLQNPNPWNGKGAHQEHPQQRTEGDLLAGMRKTTRNLIRRAEKEGIEVLASKSPNDDLHAFLELHNQTRMRHGFTPYSARLFQAQVHRFAPRNELTMYLAKHKGTLLAASIHMHVGGETSYHHGASAQSPLPASYALQWKAICDARNRSDRAYSFWGIAPGTFEEGRYVVLNPKHPFAGVTLFKTGFGGDLLPLVACMDLPLRRTYYATRAFEILRKWKRGF